MLMMWENAFEIALRKKVKKKKKKPVVCICMWKMLEGIT